MPDGQFLRVKNWKSFQQYKDRDPTWIKLHRSLLTDYDFDSLTELQQIHLVKIWLLAAKLNNQIPNDAKWVTRQIGAKSKPDLNHLVTSGFLESYGNVHECTLTRSREERREEKNREEKKLHWSNDFDRFWRVYPVKKGKKPCRAKWQQKKFDPDILVQDVQARIESDAQWKQGYIPNPLTYLNQERFNDQLSRPKPADIPAAERVLQQAAEYLRNETGNGSVMGENDSTFRIEVDP